MDIIIKNGFIYDPINNIDGEKIDLYISNGKIVDELNKRRVKVIDASGMTIMPGGIDIHSHIAGAEVNAGRLLRPEDHFKDYEKKTNITRSGVGRSVPSTFTTGYRYSKMGYTTIMNPSMPPLEARHTHEELEDTPMLDKASYPLLGDWWFVLEYLRDDDIQACAAHVAWLMNATKGYAIKIVNPGGVEAWGFGKNVKNIDDPVPHFNVTPKEIIRGLCEVNKLLNMPHTIHVHTNRLGQPGNYVTALKTMKCVEDLADGNQPNIHITHCQFSSFKGEDWNTLESGSEEISRYVNNHNHVTIDLGQVVFTDTTTMTADGPWQYTLYEISNNKWINHDVETETGSGIVPFRYRPKSYVHAIMWSIGLELALIIKDPWKVYLTTDHPNAAPFTTYPTIIAWLMSKKARESTFQKINRRARAKSLLPSIDREYNLFEITIATRAGQGKALGLLNKGHLKKGADADIAIYDINPEKINSSRDYRFIKKAFERSVYTIKDGEILVKDGEIVKTHHGKIIWSNINLSNPLEVTSELKKRFREYWTVEYENYIIPESFLDYSKPISIKADL